MFTGIIQSIGTITHISQGNKSYKFTVQNDQITKTVQLGSSVCVSGVCLTVANIQGNEMIFDIMNESIKKTSLRDKQVGDAVNLEPSLRLGDEMGGHIVFGHVDVTAKVKEIQQDGDSWLITIDLPKQMKPYIAPQGTISVDGISLTIARFDDVIFTVSIVNYTWEHTTISSLSVGDVVNLEGDMLAKYVQNAVKQYIN